ncbi:MAG TPA: DUF192 domain-containing protein [Bdellovibrionales bacterium]|nr:DUF192 domain-containing protein [Bdellovibrionales bacterium]
MRKLAIMTLVAPTLVWAVEFKAEKISLGKQTLLVEVADTEERRQQGLMYRKTLEDGKGMLFVFENERPQSFWMKNTYVPLSIGFFSSKKVLIEHFDMEPASDLEKSPKVYSAKKFAQYALEVPQGWFKRAGIKIGDKFEFVSESKPEKKQTTSESKKNSSKK